MPTCVGRRVAGGIIAVSISVWRAIIVSISGSRFVSCKNIALRLSIADCVSFVTQIIALLPIQPL